MPALPEYKTRTLLANEGVTIVDGNFVIGGSDLSDSLPNPPVYIKAQIPGATSRAAHGLVRRADTRKKLKLDVMELLAPGEWGKSEGVLITSAIDMVDEYYAACMLDIGGEGRLPGGILLFSTEGGSGVEKRSESLRKIPFSLLSPPDAEELGDSIGDVINSKTVALFLEKLINTFIRYKLIVLEINPIGVCQDGSLLVIDCRAEFEKHAVIKADKELFADIPASENEQTHFERIVELINEAEPAGTGFVRENREPVPDNAFCVATNLCGGGGKMLWEMTTGARKDIYSMNESDTSGGLSAFKSYRILRAILSLKGAQVLLLTGSGMAFQDQYHLAAAVWKALRESPTPLPALLRFGGTEEEKARQLIDQVAANLPVRVQTFQPHIFPNAMVEKIAGIAVTERVLVTPPAQPEGQPTFRVNMPPGDFFYFPERWTSNDPPPCVDVCPTDFLIWNRETRTIEPAEGSRCIGCLLCETVSLLEGNRELRIKLEMPEVG